MANLSFRLSRAMFTFFRISIVLCLIHWTTLCSSSFTSGEATWQTNNRQTSLMEESTYTSLPAIVFSPSGRLHAVEATVNACANSGNVLLAINCRDGVVVLSTMTLSPYLNETLLVPRETASPFVKSLCPTLMGGVAGNLVDNQVFMTQLHMTCQRLLQSCGNKETPSASLLARQVADQLQIPTQSVASSEGLLRSFGVIWGDNKLWRLDPTGQFWNCQAVAIGKESEKAERWLYNKLSQIEDGYSGCETLEKMSCEAALALLLECMESLLTSSQTTSKPALSSATKTFWQAVIQEHSTSSDKPPIRTFQRGAFLPPKNKE